MIRRHVCLGIVRYIMGKKIVNMTHSEEDVLFKEKLGLLTSSFNQPYYLNQQMDSSKVV